MNSIVKMVDYYLTHKNADRSVIEYLKTKLDKSDIEELIVIQIELLFTDPSDQLVSELVFFTTNKINSILNNIDLYNLSNLISSLNQRKTSLINNIEEKENMNKTLFDKIKNRDFLEEERLSCNDNEIAAKYINIAEDNNFDITKYKSEIKSIDIWLTNLENTFNKILNSTEVNTLLECYVKLLPLMNRNDYINKYIINLSNKIDSILLDNNVINTIVNIIPSLINLYKENSKEKNELYKLLDYYITIVENSTKDKIKVMSYEERLILKEKLKILCDEFASNDKVEDDYKIPIIEEYIRYL